MIVISSQRGSDGGLACTNNGHFARRRIDRDDALWRCRIGDGTSTASKDNRDRKGIITHDLIHCSLGEEKDGVGRFVGRSAENNVCNGRFVVGIDVPIAIGVSGDGVDWMGRRGSQVVDQLGNISNVHNTICIDVAQLNYIRTVSNGRGTNCHMGTSQ